MREVGGSHVSRLNANGDFEIKLGCRSTVYVSILRPDGSGRQVLVGLRSKTSLATDPAMSRISSSSLLHRSVTQLRVDRGPTCGFKTPCRYMQCLCRALSTPLDIPSPAPSKRER